MSSRTILIVDSDSVIRSSIKAFLEHQNYNVCEAGSLKEAVGQNLAAFSAVVVDAKLPDAAGSDLIKLAGNVPVIVTSSQASLKSAVAAMKLGAVDYIPKPLDFEEFARTLSGLTRGEPEVGIDILARCSTMDAIIKQLSKVAPTDTNVLIQGESGTGKELVARKIHGMSQRAERQMISFSCAAVPEASIESELFGHEHGTNPGAISHRLGLVEAADGSTLFLDEIGELPSGAQGRLLRVLQEGEVRRIGSVETRKVSVRLIASTHRDLEALVDQGAFREDLYYRLNVVKLKLPPLRERGEDVALLAQHFLENLGEQHGKFKLKFNDSARSAIESYRWPGNIRELENAIHRAVILADSKSIGAELLAIEPDKPASFPSRETEEDNVSLQDYFVKFVLENQEVMTETQIAQKLGISRKSLWQKRQRLGIPREKSRQR